MDNLRGALLMTVAMGFFALEDMVVKQMSDALSIAQILAILGFGGGAIFWTALLAKGGRLFSPALLHRNVLLRNFGEMLGTLGYASAVVLAPLSTVSAILQASPLVVAAGAALFLGETVGWRRIIAVILGFIGVLMVIQPGTEGFDPMSLLAVIGVVFLSTRDLATRNVPKDIPSEQLSASAFLLIGLVGLVWMGINGEIQPMTPKLWVQCALCILFGVLGYAAIVAATRIGELSAIVPYRYTRLLFGLVLGVFVFGEKPTTMMMAGAALIVGSGLYALWRERRASLRG